MSLLMKGRDNTLLTKVRIVKAMVFPVVTHGCESWTIKTAEHQGTDALNCGAGEDSWEPLDSKEIKLVNLKGNQPWILIGRTDAEAPVFQSPANSWPTGKVPSDGEGLRAEKMVSEGEMADWHYRFNGHELANFRRLWETRRPGMLLLSISKWKRLSNKAVGHWNKRLNIIGERVIAVLDHDFKSL